MNDDQYYYERFKERVKNLSKDELNNEYICACSKGELDRVEYLLTSPELKEKADIFASNNRGFRWSSICGNLEVIKYLLASPDLKGNVHVQINEAFIGACENGKIDIVKYLLTTPGIKEHVNIHANKDMGFIEACINKQIEISKYFIFELNIKKTNEIRKYLRDSRNEQVEKMFMLRELNQSLEKELCSNKTNKKKIKL